MPDDHADLEIIHRRHGRAGNVELTASIAGEVLHADLVEIARAADRARFAEDLCRGRPGLDRPAIERELLRIHSEHAASAARAGADAVGADPDEVPIVARTWPEPPAEAAWHGPAGELARAVGPYTEADPAGVLVQLLVGFGNLIGHLVYFLVNATRHYTNLFACTAGPTGMGRKGTAWDIVRTVLFQVDDIWANTRVTGGLVSGEGLIWEVRDKLEVQEQVREKGQPARVETVLKDAGVSDKRCMIVETEMAGLLRVLGREGNTLSAMMRQAWDSGNLRSMAKNNPNRATDAHVSIVGHVTEHEVRKYLSEVDAANGFANRFLWLAVRQCRFLPDGPAIPMGEIQPLIDRIKEAAEFARDPRRVDRDPEAAELWHRVYPGLCRPRPGLLGLMLGRAVPQVMRLAVIYAMLDRSGSIGRAHLEAALAVWDFAERSAAFIFDDSFGDRDADTLMEALRAAPAGLTRTQIRSEVFQRHRSSGEITKLLSRLLECGVVESEVDGQTGGRPRTTWRLKGPSGTSRAAPTRPEPARDPGEGESPRGGVDSSPARGARGPAPEAPKAREDRRDAKDASGAPSEHTTRASEASPGDAPGAPEAPEDRRGARGASGAPTETTTRGFEAIPEDGPESPELDGSGANGANGAGPSEDAGGMETYFL